LAQSVAKIGGTAIAVFSQNLLLRLRECETGN
jgi:hypothetical protein